MLDFTYLPGDHVPLPDSFYHAAKMAPDGFHAWAITMDETLAQLESTDYEEYEAAALEFLDKAERRGAISAALAEQLREFHEL
jgi:hypothetical protein